MLPAGLYSTNRLLSVKTFKLYNTMTKLHKNSTWLTILKCYFAVLWNSVLTQNT